MAKTKSGKAPPLLRSKVKKALELLQNNRLPEARDAYRQLLQKLPRDAELWFMCGTVEGRMGDVAAAERCMQKSLELRPELHQAWLGLGQCLELQNKIDEATTHYQKAVRLDPQFIDAWEALGRLYAQSGDSQGASASYKRAMELKPGEMAYVAAYADAVFREGDIDEALMCYRRALDLAPGHGKILSRIGQLYLHISEFDKARDFYEQAVQASPNDVHVLMGKAHLLSLDRDMAGARAMLAPLADQYPDNPEVLIAYASVVAAEQREGLIAKMEKLIALDWLPPGDRKSLAFQLGALLNKEKSYDQAFLYYKKANDLATAPFDRDAAVAYAEFIYSTYDKEFIDTAPQSECESEVPVFIVGMPRSGTSLVEQILSSHPQVFGAGELFLLSGSRKKFWRPSSLYEDVSLMTAPALTKAAQAHLASLQEKSPTAARITDKMPQNFFYLGFLSRLFPRAKIIHCQRDPMDTCLSCYFQSFMASLPYTNRLDDLGFYYQQYQNIMAHWQAVLGDRILNVQYENLVTDNEPVVRAMIDFIGLDWDERCLDHSANARSVVTASYDQATKPLYTGSMQRWRHYEKHLAPLKEALGLGPE